MPGLGSPCPSPTAAAGQPSLPRSPFPAGWLPSKEQQEKSWLLAGKGSQRQGRAGRESDAFPMLERTILASIPVIAATCWLPQPSPPSPRSPRPLLGLLYSPPTQTCLSSPVLGRERAAPVLHHGPVNPAGAAGNFQHTLKPLRKMMDPGLYRSPGPSFSFFPPSLLQHEYLSPRLGCLLAGRRHRHSCRNSSFSRHRVQPGAGARGRQPFSFPIPPSSMESKHCSSHKGGYCGRTGGRRAGGGAGEMKCELEGGRARESPLRRGRTGCEYKFCKYFL